MKSNVKYSLYNHQGAVIGYFLDNKFYDLHLGVVNFEAELKPDGFVYDLTTGLKSAKVVDSKYTRLSDGVEFLIQEST